MALGARVIGGRGIVDEGAAPVHDGDHQRNDDRWNRSRRLAMVVRAHAHNRSGVRIAVVPRDVVCPGRNWIGVGQWRQRVLMDPLRWVRRYGNDFALRSLRLFGGAADWGVASIRGRCLGRDYAQTCQQNHTDQGECMQCFHVCPLQTEFSINQHTAGRQKDGGDIHSARRMIDRGNPRGPPVPRPAYSNLNAAHATDVAHGSLLLDRPVFTKLWNCGRKNRTKPPMPSETTVLHIVCQHKPAPGNRSLRSPPAMARK